MDSVKASIEKQAELTEGRYFDLRRLNLKFFPQALNQYIDRIEGVCLDNNKLDKFPSSVFRFPNLRSLSLENNAIGRLPEFPPQSALSQICLNRNYIEELPDSLFQLPELRILRVANNRVSKVYPSGKSPLGLERLNLSSNKLKSFPLSYLLGKRMIEINLSSNQILSFLMEDRISEMNKSEGAGSLGSLHREKSWLSLADNGICELPDGISLLKHLVGLDISRNELKKIPELLLDMRGLKSVDLSSNPLSAKAVTDFQTACPDLDLVF